MTFTWIILAVSLMASVWIAVDLLGPGPSRPEKGNFSRAGRRRNQRLYEPIVRLFADEDLDYLSAHSDLLTRLEASRSATMRLYLVELRREFLEIWQTCRLLAPISPDPSFLSRLSRQYWSFHWTYANAYAGCLFPALARQTLAVRLVSALSQMRAEAGQLLAVSDSALSAPAAA